MLTPVEAFHYGFLLRCAEEGLTPVQTAERIKQASAQPLLQKQGSFQLLDALKHLGWTGLGVSAIGGAGLGYTAAKAMEGDVDASDYSKQDLIAAYNTAAQQARSRAARLQHYRLPPPTKRLF